MALRKEVDTEYGTKAEYWRLDSFFYNKRGENISATFGLYQSQKASKLAAYPFRVIDLNFSPTDTTLELRGMCYEKAKETILTESEDV